MKHIRQKHKNTCGIACIAMLSNSSYESVVKLTNPQRRWWFQSIVAPDYDSIIKALQRLGCSVGTWQVGPVSLDVLATPAVIVIQLHNSYHHAVVWHPQSRRILDPSCEINTFFNQYYEKLSIGYLLLM